jgi:F-type H+-transporting ATPase subunit a
MVSTIFKTFAATDSGIHVSLKAEKVFEIGGLTVTNSMIYGAVVALFLCLLIVPIARKSTVKAKKGAVALVEIIVNYVVGMLEGAFGSREKAYKYAPVFATFFIFILCTNALGLLPIVGPGIAVDGIPVFRPFTADLNGTIVMAVFGIVAVQVLSIRAQGLRGHLTHYFTDKPMNPINFFIGVLEVFGEFTRMISLSLRLFLNTAVGEILIAVFTSLILTGGRTPIAVLPIILFELLVAGIQAYVFTVLTATYLSLAIAHADHTSEHHNDTAQKVEELSVHVNQKVTTGQMS